jgi:hypothetical protein
MEMEIPHLEPTVRRKVLKDALIIVGWTLLFFVLCATAGISLSAPPAPPSAKAAYEGGPASDAATLWPGLSGSQEGVTTSGRK